MSDNVIFDNTNDRMQTINGIEYKLPRTIIRETGCYVPSFNLKEFIESGYRYLTRLLPDCRTLVLTVEGNARLANVAGYLQGMKDSGNVQAANQYAEWFLTRLEGLLSCQMLSIEIDGIVRQNVPSQKTLLADDGCLHSFGFTSYSLINPTKYLSELWALQQNSDWKACSHTAQRNEVHKKLRCLSYRLTEPMDSGLANPLNAEEWHSIAGTLYYQYRYNGGFLFHGVNQLSVRVGNDSNPWSTHT